MVYEPEEQLPILGRLGRSAGDILYFPGFLVYTSGAGAEVSYLQLPFVLQQLEAQRFNRVVCPEVAAMVQHVVVQVEDERGVDAMQLEGTGPVQKVISG